MSSLLALYSYGLSSQKIRQGGGQIGFQGGLTDEPSDHILMVFPIILVGRFRSQPLAIKGRYDMRCERKLLPVKGR